MVFARVPSECGSPSSGKSDYYCTDFLGGCVDNVVAYTHVAISRIVVCTSFFSELSPQSTRWHKTDQANTVLHEMTHLDHVGETVDFGQYGYNSIRKLTAAENLNHAATYALFAQGTSSLWYMTTMQVLIRYRCLYRLLGMIGRIVKRGRWTRTGCTQVIKCYHHEKI